MGIGRGTVKLLVQEALRRPFEGKLLTLGKQDVWIGQKELERIAAEFGFALREAKGIDPLSHKPEMKSSGFISDVYLFARLGFDECRSMDYSSYEGCDFPFDLNLAELPSSLLGKFDVIFDGGTIEHVFHLPNVLANLFKMAAVGGRIIHGSPSSNHIDHGFYMFSPTFFWDYYTANRFEINQMQVIRHNPWHDRLWKVWNYRPGCLNSVSYGGLDSGMYAIHCVVTKGAEASSHVIPQQRNYEQGAWKGSVSLDAGKNGFFRSVKRKIKNNALFYALLRPLVMLLRPRKGVKLKTTARY